MPRDAVWQTRAGGTARRWEQLDAWRHQQGALLERLGFGPVEAPYEVIFSEPAVRLRRYADSDNKGPALLIIPAPIKRAYIWDLAPEVSVVRRCLESGFQVHLLEWTEPGDQERGFALADYADRLIGDCLEVIGATTGQRRIALTAHSLGGTFAAIFSALHPDRVRALVTLEAPLRFGKYGGVFAPFVAACPDARIIAAGLDAVPGSFLSFTAILAAPVTFGWRRWVDRLRSSQDPHMLATHLRVERWAMDEMPLPRRLFAEIVESLYRDDAFLRGKLTVAGRRVAPECLSMPILSVVDPHSSIIPVDSALPTLPQGSRWNRSVLRYDGDTGIALRHVGVLVGRSAHRRLWPEILRWLRCAASEGSKQYPTL